jgi:hypothetical protein
MRSIGVKMGEELMELGNLGKEASIPSERDDCI